MSTRLLFLPVAAMLIAGLCAYKLTREYDDSELAAVRAGTLRPAPRLEVNDPRSRLVDSENRLFRFESYLGRHRMLVVFFDGEAGADRDPVLARLRRDYAELASRNIKVVAVSPALPQENRRAAEVSGEFPFPLVTDLPPDYRLHRGWGRFDERENSPLQGVFLIDRAGRVAWADDKPEPAVDADRAIDAIIRGTR